jgi:hypothetical protein
MYTNQAQVRSDFWRMFHLAILHKQGKVEGRPRKFSGKSQNDLPADVRAAFVDFVDHLAREGTISARLANRVTI